VKVGILKDKRGNITLYDAGWKQLDYLKMTGSCCWAPIRQQMEAIGLNPDRVVRIITGHSHWDHSGQLSDFPNAVLYVQKEELKQIDFFLNYPPEFNDGRIRAVNTTVTPNWSGCARSPVCGYPPQTVQEVLGKVLHGKARIIDGRHEVEPGMIIHPAFRGHTYGSQLLQVNTARGQLVFGSDTYSSWDGIRKWYAANIQQTDTIQQFLAYEKCYALTSRQGGVNNCVAAHEPTSYTPSYPITSNWWNIPGGNCSRAAELTLSNGERTHVPANPNRVKCEGPIP
jgi:glyoxylase-like metal-dependent hydrolase (beta-lactamase superfamily II)